MLEILLLSLGSNSLSPVPATATLAKRKLECLEKSPLPVKSSRLKITAAENTIKTPGKGDYVFFIDSL